MPIKETILIVTGTALAATAVAAAVYIHRIRVKKTEKNADDVLLVEGIARHAQLYNGLYEGIYQNVIRDDLNDMDAYKEWCGRTSYIEGDPEFVRLFAQNFDGKDNWDENGYGEKLKRLLHLIQKAGIVRGTETELAMDTEVRKAYLYLGEGVPSDGTVLMVMKPCWEYCGQIVEQGVLMKKDG